MKAKSDRLLSVYILKSLVSGSGSLSSLLKEARSDNPDANLALVSEYTYGVCRWYHQLAFFSSRLMDKPLRNKDLDVHCLILLGLYQLFHMRTPDHAAVNESVALTRQLKKPWAKNLVNAVLRQALRDMSALEEAAKADSSARLSHPEWLASAFQADWPEQAESLMLNNNQRAPMILRVNSQRCPREDYLSRLSEAAIPARPGPHTSTAVILESPVEVSELPGFEAGLVSVQDEASQLVAPLLNPASGDRILDACAAPGGKTCSLLEYTPGLSMQALDNSESRLARVRENLERCHLEADLLCADATETGAWWNGEPFDKILLDAPCSGTGVIRRHPDIKLLRRQQDLAELKALQQKLLMSLWACLKPGGRLLYSTCSVLRDENERQVAAFLDQTPDAVNVPISIDGALTCSIDLQFLPAVAGTDGFYYALLEKQ